MEFEKYIAFLYIIYESFFCLVMGQTINEEKSDCAKLSNFINGSSQDNSNSCCSNNNEIKCDSDGYITYLDLKETLKTVDISLFPHFSRIETVMLDGNELKEIPNNIFNLNTLKYLTLNSNKITELPKGLSNLKNLKQLSLSFNKIKELPNELFDLTDLQSLNLYGNNIKNIPSAIQNLSKLERLYLSKNNIGKLPNEIFNLNNLKLLEIDNNPLKTKIIKFGNSTIDDCFFKNIQILCYEPNTCNSIHLSDRDLSDSEAENEYEVCSKRKDDENEDGKSHYFIINGIVLVCIIAILIAIFTKYMLKKKIKSKKYYIKNLENVQYISSRNDHDNEHVGNNNGNNSEYISRNNDHDNEHVGNNNENNSEYSQHNLSVDNLISNNLDSNNLDSTIIINSITGNSSQNVPPTYDELKSSDNNESLPGYTEYT